MNMQALALAFLVAVTLGGLAWVFLYPLLSGEKKAEKKAEKKDGEKKDEKKEEKK